MRGGRSKTGVSSCRARSRRAARRHRRSSCPCSTVTMPEENDAEEAEGTVTMPDDDQVQRLLRRVLSDESDARYKNYSKRARWS